MSAEAVLKNIKTRRVIRNFSDQPVEREKLEKILEAGRWAPAGGNQRFVHFVAVQDPELLRLLRLVSPGMMQYPQAMILLCHDAAAQAFFESKDSDCVHSMDQGTTMQNMMLAAHALGLGSGPVTSFSHEAVRVILNLPDHLHPEVLIPIGYKGTGSQVPMKAKKKVTWQSLTDWDRYT